MIKALLFDLDETLLDRQASIQRFLQDQYQRFAHALAPIPFAHYQERFLALDEYGYVAKDIVYPKLVAELGLDLDPLLLYNDFYTNGWNPSILMAHAVQVLELRRDQGYKLGIITNGSITSQRAKIENSALARLIDTALISEAEGVRKPDQAIFARAAERLGVAVTECVFIGDNPEADILGAYNAGMKAVWFKGHLPWPDGLTIRPHATIEQLSALLHLDWDML